MAARIHCALIALIFVLAFGLSAHAQIRPEVTPKPKKPPAAKKPAAKLPEKKPEPAPAQIVIETSPNAEVYLDDQFVGRASAGGRLLIGNATLGLHRLRVSLAGKVDYEGQVNLTDAQMLTVEAVLHERYGTLQLETRPGADIVIDGQRRYKADSHGNLALTDLMEGTHSVTIEAEGFQSREETFRIIAGTTAQVSAELKPTRRTLVDRTFVVQPIRRLPRPLNSRIESQTVSNDLYRSDDLVIQYAAFYSYGITTAGISPTGDCVYVDLIFNGSSLVRYGLTEGAPAIVEKELSAPRGGLLKIRVEPVEMLTAREQATPYSPNGWVVLASLTAKIRVEYFP